MSTLPVLAYAGKTRHEAYVYYTWDDGPILGADIAIYYN